MRAASRIRGRWNSQRAVIVVEVGIRVGEVAVHRPSSRGINFEVLRIQQGARRQFVVTDWSHRAAQCGAQGVIRTAGHRQGRGAIPVHDAVVDRSDAHEDVGVRHPLPTGPPSASQMYTLQKFARKISCFVRRMGLKDDSTL